MIITAEELSRIISRLPDPENELADEVSIKHIEAVDGLISNHIYHEVKFKVIRPKGSKPKWAINIPVESEFKVLLEKAYELIPDGTEHPNLVEIKRVLFGKQVPNQAVKKGG